MRGGREGVPEATTPCARAAMGPPHGQVVRATPCPSPSRLLAPGVFGEIVSVSDSHVQGMVRLPERVREGAEHGGHTVLD